MTPIVFTMGKVGSTAMSSAMHRAGSACFDLHTLSGSGVAARALTNALPDPTDALWITAIREPIARNLSAFFENIDLNMPKTDRTPERALSVFLETYYHQIPARWFDREIKPKLGINIYDHPFDPERGFVYVSEPNKLLVLRADLPDQTKSSLLSMLVRRPVHIERANVGNAKGTASLYRETCKLARTALPKSYVDEMLSTEYVRHFWTPSEIDALRARWSA